MATILRDGDLSLLRGKVAIIGYGAQGHAHALNLRDSGVQVHVGLREGSASRGKAEEAGLTVGTAAEATKGAQLVAMLVPDQVAPTVFAEEVEPNLEPGSRRPLRSRLQRPLRPHRAVGRPRRGHGRAEGAR